MYFGYFLQVDKKCVSGHTLKNVLCCEPIEKRKCSESCCRSLACGHPCSAKCYIDCLTLSCEVEVVSSVEPACGHPAPKIPCHMNTSGTSCVVHNLPALLTTL